MFFPKHFNCRRFNPMAIRLFALVMAILAVASAGEAEERDRPAIWRQMPLRTANQLAAGLAGGEGMQMIWGLSHAPTNSDIVYLLSDTSQVWKSEDGGHSWRMKHNGFLANGGVSLVVSSVDENTVFAAGSVQESASDSDDLVDGVYRTRDGGESWKLARQTAFYTLENDKGGVNFAFRPDAEGNVIHAGTHREGLLKSIDGGDSWHSLGVLEQVRILDVKIHPRNPSRIYMACKDGLYRFDDDGSETLVKLGSNLPDHPRVVLLHPERPETMYVSAGASGVWKSTDGGVSFAARNNGLEPLTQGNEATYMAMSPVDPNRLYVSFYLWGGNHPYYSHDGGDTWREPSEMDAGELMFAVNDARGGEFLASPIAVSPDDANIAITSGNGNHLQISRDGGDTWRYSGNGYTGGRAGEWSGFSWDPNDPRRFAIFLTDFGVVLTNDGGATFKNLRAPRFNGSATASAGALDPEPGSKVIVAAVGQPTQIIAVSDDEGASWTLAEDAEAEHKFIAFHPQKPDIVYAGGFRSNDKGKTWEALPRSVAAMFPGDGDVVYATEPSGFFVTLLRSTDGGNTWERPYPAVESVEVHQIAVDSVDRDRIYLASGVDGLLIWNGARWVRKTDGDGLEKDRFGVVPTRYVAVDPKRPHIVYAGSWLAFRGHSNGVFRSGDRGETWKNINGNLGAEFTPWAISVNPHDGYVYIGSSHGVWRTTSCDPSAAAGLSASTGRLDALVGVSPGGAYNVTLNLLDPISQAFDVESITPATPPADANVAVYSPPERVLSIPGTSVFDDSSCGNTYSVNLLWETGETGGQFRIVDARPVNRLKGPWFKSGQLMHETPNGKVANAGRRPEKTQSPSSGSTGSVVSY